MAMVLRDTGFPKPGEHAALVSNSAVTATPWEVLRSDHCASLHQCIRLATWPGRVSPRRF